MHVAYTLREELHRSTRRIVYRAVRDGDQCPLIIKSLQPGWASDQEVDALTREYKILSSLSIDGVPRAYDLVSHGDNIHLVLEDRGGSTLSEYMRSSKHDVKTGLHIALDLVKVLDGVHRQQVVHRDLNPANVLVDQAGKVTLIDFSISTRQPEHHVPVSHPSRLEGTLAYLSPEQTGRMNRPVDYRSDLYSLGVTLFELFSGRLPFQADDPMELVYCHLAVPPPRVHDIGRDIPRSVGDVIGKLLEKAPEDRYQSALGIVHDLRTCLEHLHDAPEEFRPARRDVRDWFSIPRKLYGRHDESRSLMAAFDRVSLGGVELVLVAGYSGIGKSALVHSVQTPVTDRRGYFVSGKFDQLRLAVPYSAFVAALRELIRQLLTESDDALATWKSKLLTALDGNGQLVIDVIPEVAHIVGPQPPVRELNPAESRNRFQLVFRNFLRVFCRTEHPLVIFLDDLQWVDPASLALLDTILPDDDSHHLLLIGAYRDNEVDAAHPLTAAVQALATEEHVRVTHLTVGSLPPHSVTELLCDTLHRDQRAVAPLQQLVLEKTAGNPYFLSQLLTTLYGKGSLSFDYASNRWTWDIDELEAMNITSNVVDLMTSRLNGLPQTTQRALSLAACLGSRFQVETLQALSSERKHDVLDDLQPAIEAGLVTHDRDGSKAQGPLGIVTDHARLRFSHDRVQQAAYAMLSEEAKHRLHLQIGLQLQSSVPDTAKSERLFETVEQLNFGSDLITDDAGRKELARLNLEAARRAVSATAYAAACTYARAGLGALPADGWQKEYPLSRDLHRVLVDAEYLRGDFEVSQRLISTMLSKLHTPVEQTEVQSALVVQQTLGGRYRDAIATCCDALAKLDINLPTGDQEAALFEELARYRKAVGSCDPESLIDAPQTASHESAVAARLLAALLPLCYIADPSLCRLASVRGVTLSLTHGLTPNSPIAYGFFGLLHSSVLHNYRDAYKFGRLAIDLAERHADSSQVCRTTHMFCAFINHWNRHLQEFDEVNRRGFQAGLQSGELQFAGYHRYNRALCLFHLGTNLKDLVGELEELIRFGRKTRNQHGTDPAVAVMRAVLDLAQETPEPGSFLFEEMSEEKFLADLVSRNARPAIGHYHIIKSQVLYLYGRDGRGDHVARKRLRSISHSFQVIFRPRCMSSTPLLFQRPQSNVQVTATSRNVWSRSVSVSGSSSDGLKVARTTSCTSRCLSALKSHDSMEMVLEPPSCMTVPSKKPGAAGISKKRPSRASEPVCFGWSSNGAKSPPCISPKRNMGTSYGVPRGRPACWRKCMRD